MIKGFVNPLYLDRIIADLGGYECIADSREGALIDSLLFYTDNSVIALIEHYLNCWSSCYRVEIAPIGTRVARDIESYFTMSYTLD